MEDLAATRPNVQARRRATILGYVVLAVVAIWWPLPVLLHDGWPANHESYAPFQRVETFRRAFLAGNWYPTWTPFCHSGYGSAYPLLYHRLFSTAGAFIATVLTPSVITAVKSLVVVLLFIGGAGMRRLLRVSGAAEPWAVAGAVLLMIAPYTLTDWLVRGAMAEFTAMMLLPWLYAEMCLFLRGSRHWIRTAVLTVLLFHAHSMICYFFLLSAAGFLVASALSPSRKTAWHGARSEWARIITAGAIVGFGVIAQVIVASSLLPYFNTDRLTQYPLTIHDNYWPLSRYFVDDVFVWGVPSRSISLELSRYACAAAVLLHAMPGAAPRWRWVLRVPLYSFFLICIVACLLLQLPEFEVVFRTLPRATFLQFPWRLLCFMTIGSIFVLITGARSALRGGRFQQTAAVVCLSLTVILTAVRFGTTTPLDEYTFTSSEIEADLKDLDGPEAGGEYLLKAVTREQLLPRRGLVQAPGCDARVERLESPSFGEIVLSVKSAQSCRISLRQFQTPLLDVELHNARLVSTVPSREFLVEIESGQSIVQVRPRSFWQLLGWALTSARAASPPPSKTPPAESTSRRSVFAFESDPRNYARAVRRGSDDRQQ